MPLTIQSLNVNVGISGLTFSNPSEISRTQDRINSNLTTSFPVGNGAGQANMVWSDQRTIAAGLDDDINIESSLIDAYGQPIAFAAIKQLVVLNRSANPATILTVGNTGGNWPPTPWQAPCGPGDAFTFGERQSGITVVATTSDTLRITNTDGSNAATYDIVLVGVQ